MATDTLIVARLTKSRRTRSKLRCICKRDANVIFPRNIRESRFRKACFTIRCCCISNEHACCNVSTLKDGWLKARCCFYSACLRSRRLRMCNSAQNVNVTLAGRSFCFPQIASESRTSPDRDEIIRERTKGQRRSRGGEYFSSSFCVAVVNTSSRGKPDVGESCFVLCRL